MMSLLEVLASNLSLRDNTKTSQGSQWSHSPASPHFQARPPIVQYQIIFLAQRGREGEVGLELSLSTITISVELSLCTIAPIGKIIGDWVDGDLSKVILL